MHTADFYYYPGVNLYRVAMKYDYKFGTAEKTELLAENSYGENDWRLDYLLKRSVGDFVFACSVYYLPKESKWRTATLNVFDFEDYKKYHSQRMK